jgi:alpha-N-arabinofuranosidase
MGRCIYTGIYDPDNKNGLSDKDGFRTDVIAALKDLNIPVMRYPGGNFVATYHWLDGVGPREKRPKRPELAWLTEESNQFGTDEFMKWCEVLGTEPYLALNFGTGTLDEGECRYGEEGGREREWDGMGRVLTRCVSFGMAGIL